MLQAVLAFRIPLVLAALLFGLPPRHAWSAAPDSMASDPGMSVAPANSLPASSVAGFDAESHATVAVTIGHVTLDIPRSMVVGMFVNPLYCLSGHGVCGKVYAPQLAFLYPGMTPIPPNRIAEFRVLSAARHPDLIYAVLVGHDEPERVAAFVGPWKDDELEPGPYDLYRMRTVSGILVAFPGTIDAVRVDTPVSGQLVQTEQCNAQKYIIGDIHLAFQFNASLLPHWADINQKLSGLIESFARK